MSTLHYQEEKKVSIMFGGKALRRNDGDRLKQTAVPPKEVR